MNGPEDPGENGARTRGKLQTLLAERRLKQGQTDASRDAACALGALIEEAFPALPPSLGEPGGGS